MFGALAVGSMLVFYALEHSSPGSCWPLREAAWRPPLTASSRAPGRLGSWSSSGRVSRSGGGGVEPAAFRLDRAHDGATVSTLRTQVPITLHTTAGAAAIEFGGTVEIALQPPGRSLLFGDLDPGEER